MDLYLDTADQREVDRFFPLGAFKGVTTNPIILAKANVTAEQICAVLLRSQDGVVFLQAQGASAEAMVTHGLKLAGLNRERIRIKVPATPMGIEAMAGLTELGVQVAATAVFTLGQALYAMAAGARILIPFYGRLSASGGDADALVRDLVLAASRPESETQVLVASLKNADQVQAVFRAGGHAVTLPPAVAEALLASPLTDAAVADFDKAAQAGVKNPDE